jgi:MFS family permease
VILTAFFVITDGIDPKTVHPVYGIPACDVPVMPRDDPLWSHSLYCDNNQYILDQTQGVKTAYSTLNILGTILFLPTGGHIGDVWGRKKVIFWTGFVSIGITMCYWLDTLEAGGDMHGMKYFFLAALFHMMHAPAGPVSNTFYLCL